MRLERLGVSTRGWTLGEGASNSRRGWGHRSSVEVRALTSGGAGLGEACPLPGYSPEGFDDVERALSGVDVASAPTFLGIRDVFEWVARCIPLAVPSARFALETALLDALAREREVPVWRLLQSDATFRAVSTCALLPAVVDEGALDVALDATARAIGAGAAAVKFKIGHPGALDRELAVARAIRERHPTLPVRLDANGMLNPNDVEILRRALSSTGIEFVEEPVHDSCNVDLPCPVALDETLQAARLDGLDDAVWSWARARGAHAVFVLKPTSLGGWSRCLEIHRRARAARVRCVMSHAFGGAVELAACHHLAIVCQAEHDLAAGLFPHAGLPHAPHTFEPTRLESTPGLGVVSDTSVEAVP